MFYQLILLCCLCAIILWRLRYKKQSDFEPPQLSGKLPIVGHAHKLIGDSTHIYNCIQKISDECIQKGGVITVNLGPRKVYCVANPDDCLTLANSCLEKHEFYDFAKSFLGNGLLSADVMTWKRNRKLLNPAFNQQVLDSFIEIFNTQAQSLVQRFENEIGKPFDQENLLRKNNLETICMTAFGVDACQYGDLFTEYHPRFVKVINCINERMQKFWLHSDFIYNMTKQKKVMEEEIKHLMALSKSIIQKKKKERAIHSDKEHKTGNLKTFIDLILDLADDTGCFTDDQIRQETENIIAGGHDTVATLMTLVFAILGSHYDVQQKAYKELIHVLGPSEKNVDRDDLSKLVYIEAILKETLRLYPILPIMPKRIDKDIQLENYTIKRNSECFISIFSLHRHSIWGPDADQFRPERWLEKETLPDLKYFGGFGLGRRNCIGKAYAMMSMKIILAHVLRTYRISSDISKMVLKLHVSVRPESGHYITLALRNTTDRA